MLGAHVRRQPNYLALSALVFAVVTGGGPTVALGLGTGTAAPPVEAPADCRIDHDVFIHGSRRSHDIALTFDACPTSHVPGFSSEIVDLLAHEHVAATFFISGRWAETHPHELARLVAVPFFETALHGYRHRRLTSADRVRTEIEDGRSALQRLNVQPQPLFRPPFGDRPATLAAVAQHSGVTPVLWDVAPGDPSPQETAAALERDVLRQARGGSIVVMHVNGRGIGTGAALPTLLARLRERGFHFVTVSELLHACHAPTLP